VQKQWRVVATIIYLIVIFLIQYFYIGDGFPLDGKALWVFNGTASLLLGSRLLNPHFTPPADAATNSFFAGASMLAALSTTPTLESDHIIIWSVFLLCVAIFLSSSIVIIFKSNIPFLSEKWVVVLQRIVQGIGSPRVIFTLLILCLVWLFHRSEPVEVFLILSIWTLIVALDPVESVFALISWIKNRIGEIRVEVSGIVVGRQVPGLTTIRQLSDKRLQGGNILLINNEQGPPSLGIVLNSIGKDEGNLLRVLDLDFPDQLTDRIEGKSFPQESAVEMKLDEQDRNLIGALSDIELLCGIVDTDSTISTITIELTNDRDIAEGRLVHAKIGNKSVIYQVIDGITKEDSVQRKNKYGYVKALARKIGEWDADKSAFAPVPWVPKINSPVYLLSAREFAQTPEAIGHFPQTDYSASVNISDVVTHNTAILGILGIGKSYLSIELVERMISEGIKVICLDLTDQYAGLLRDFVNDERQQAWDSVLVEAAKGRPVGTGKEEGGSIHAFIDAAKEQLREFMSGDCQEPIRVLNPANFRVSRQTTNAFKGSAGFSDLTPCEITAIISDQLLKICQEMGMTDRARACLVYEEAHSLVPEWNSVANDGDKNATASSARAILQGRKFGLGCLLITQRTANVTKTILNQCNTIFAMRTFDDTGKEFLGNYIGVDYARVLPSLQERHAVLFGKASSCDDPVLLRLNDRDKFLKGFRKQE